MNILSREGVKAGGDEVSSEVIEEQFTIILSRDYTHLIGTMCYCTAGIFQQGKI